MKTSRRSFLKKGTSAIAISAGLLSVPAAAQKLIGEQPKRNMAKSLAAGSDAYEAISAYNIADFQKQVGSYFRFISPMYGESGGELIEVRELKQPAGKENLLYHTDGFTLHFKPQKSEPVFQDVFLVEHAELGMFYMLMSPVRSSRKDSTVIFEAVVNRFA